jgi:hypothetical protein
MVELLTGICNLYFIDISGFGDPEKSYRYIPFDYYMN